jgi:hypothetical protein
MLLKLALTFPMFEQQGLERFGQLAGAHGCITGPPAQPPCAGGAFLPWAWRFRLTYNHSARLAPRREMAPSYPHSGAGRAG